MFGRGRVAPCLIRVCVSCEHGRGFDSSCLGVLLRPATLYPIGLFLASSSWSFFSIFPCCHGAGFQAGAAVFSVFCRSTFGILLWPKYVSRLSHLRCPSSAPTERSFSVVGRYCRCGRNSACFVFLAHCVSFLSSSSCLLFLAVASLALVSRGDSTKKALNGIRVDRQSRCRWHLEAERERERTMVTHFVRAV